MSPEFYRRMAIVGLLLNFGLIGVLFYAQASTRATLSKVEAMVAAQTSLQAAQSENDKHHPAAGRGERVALLLAAGADAEQARRLLDPLPPAECVEIARTLLARPAANDRNAALGVVFQKIASDDPTTAVTLLAVVMEASLKNELASKVAASWVEQDPASAAAWLSGDEAQYIGRPSLRQLLATAISRWSAYDPAGATRFVASSPANATTDAQQLRLVSRDWARKDPAAALAWTQSIPPGDPRKALATYGVLEGWAELAPAQAAGYVGQLTFGASRSYAGEAAAVAARWTEQAPAAAAQWAAGLPDRTARRDGLRQVAASWAKLDAPNAARWAASLPASGERAEIWQGVSDFWTDTDPPGDEAWLSTLPVGRDRDAAVAAYAAKVVATDPEKALSWAKTLSDGTFAAEQIQNLLSAWSRKDRMAARNWAAANQVLAESNGLTR